MQIDYAHQCYRYQQQLSALTVGCRDAETVGSGVQMTPRKFTWESNMVFWKEVFSGKQVG